MWLLKKKHKSFYLYSRSSSICDKTPQHTSLVLLELNKLRNPHKTHKNRKCLGNNKSLVVYTPVQTISNITEHTLRCFVRSCFQLYMNIRLNCFVVIEEMIWNEMKGKGYYRTVLNLILKSTTLHSCTWLLYDCIQALCIYSKKEKKIWTTHLFFLSIPSVDSVQTK